MSRKVSDWILNEKNSILNSLSKTALWQIFSLITLVVICSLIKTLYSKGIIVLYTAVMWFDVAIFVMTFFIGIKMYKIVIAMSQFIYYLFTSRGNILHATAKAFAYYCDWNTEKVSPNKFICSIPFVGAAIKHKREEEFNKATEQVVLYVVTDLILLFTFCVIFVLLFNTAVKPLLTEFAIGQNVSGIKLYIYPVAKALDDLFNWNLCGFFGIKF